ncbi:hypothetical protein [Streptomyces aurantiogriseus]|uniref:hypothetical protein n=1 Tax=Streptomyces aurantiogriseus TaxID=66870 RepID=UPI00167A642A|nr:hypothetical protein [Streptomyces aurantiogriseus]
MDAPAGLAAGMGGSGPAGIRRQRRQWWRRAWQQGLVAGERGSSEECRWRVVQRLVLVRHGGHLVRRRVEQFLVRQRFVVVL